ncbi:hypothetical protein chiPu_0008491 [Chiloscyllium punctatum]|uniref:Uncharacterized protein n=1 Tax=Chiloscyllium punctatum TaxID=137246 RepID=A0A401SI10_CHIPU|nr:hypothetical protein [Chiloscyllium punctatum]
MEFRVARHFAQRPQVALKKVFPLQAVLTGKWRQAGEVTTPGLEVSSIRRSGKRAENKTSNRQHQDGQARLINISLKNYQLSCDLLGSQNQQG